MQVDCKLLSTYPHSEDKGKLEDYLQLNLCYK